MKIFTKNREAEDKARMKRRLPKMTKEQIATVLGDDKPTREWMSHATYLILKDFIEKQQAKAHEEFVMASGMLGKYKWDKYHIHPEYVKGSGVSQEASEELYYFYQMKRARYDAMLKELWYAYSLAAHPNVVEDIKKTNEH
jgi:hypothetical protein